MKPLHAVLLVCVLFVSCHSTSYITSLNSTPYGVDFNKGKWYLNTLDVPIFSQDKHTEYVVKELRESLGDRLLAPEDAGYKSVFFVPMKPETVMLGELKLLTGCDYFINIKSDSPKKEMGPMLIGEVYSTMKNVTHVYFEVYDLNTQEVVFEKLVTASITVEEDDNSLSFVSSENKMIKGALKRILKDL